MKEKRFTVKEFARLAKDGSDVNATLAKPFDIGTKAADDTDRVRTFSISDESVDGHNDTISLKGWKAKKFNDNPIVLFGHQPDNLIGKSLRLFKQDAKLKSKAEFMGPDLSEFAYAVYKWVDAGFLRKASVGFKPLKWEYNEKRDGFDFLEQELREWSVVPIPANPNVGLEAKSLGLPIDPIIEWTETALDGGMPSCIWLPKQRIESFHKSLDTSTSVAMGGNAIVTDEVEVEYEKEDEIEEVVEETSQDDLSNFVAVDSKSICDMFEKLHTRLDSLEEKLQNAPAGVPNPDEDSVERVAAESEAGPDGATDTETVECEEETESTLVTLDDILEKDSEEESNKDTEEEAYSPEEIRSLVRETLSTGTLNGVAEKVQKAVQESIRKRQGYLD